MFGSMKQKRKGTLLPSGDAVVLRQGSVPPSLLAINKLGGAWAEGANARVYFWPTSQEPCKTNTTPGHYIPQLQALNPSPTMDPL